MKLRWLVLVSLVMLVSLSSGMAEEWDIPNWWTRSGNTITTIYDVVMNNLTVVNINSTDQEVNGSGNFTGNVTADYFFGNGDELTGVLDIGQDNWDNDSNGWSYWDGDSYEFNSSKLETIYHNASEYEIIAGTLDAGTLENTHHSNGNYDGTTIDISESAGSPALDLRFNFTDITEFNNIIVRLNAESQSHVVQLQLWNYDDGSWEDKRTIRDTEGFENIESGVFFDDEHIGTGVDDGVVQLRLYHEDSGIPAHTYLIDWVTISKGFGTPIGQEIDPLSIHSDGNISLMDNWNAGNYNITAIFQFDYNQSSFDWNGTYLDFNGSFTDTNETSRVNILDTEIINLENNFTAENTSIWTNININLAIIDDLTTNFTAQNNTNYLTFYTQTEIENMNSTLWINITALEDSPVTDTNETTRVDILDSEIVNLENNFTAENTTNYQTFIQNYTFVELDALRLTPYATEPFTCDSDYYGVISYSSTDSFLCVCKNDAGQDRWRSSDESTRCWN